MWIIQGHHSRHIRIDRSTAAVLIGHWLIVEWLIRERDRGGDAEVVVEGVCAWLGSIFCQLLGSHKKQCKWEAGGCFTIVQWWLTVSRVTKGEGIEGVRGLLGIFQAFVICPPPKLYWLNEHTNPAFGLWLDLNSFSLSLTLFQSTTLVLSAPPRSSSHIHSLHHNQFLPAHLSLR